MYKCGVKRNVKRTIAFDPTDVDFELMMVAAFRYCLGRHSYIVGACKDFFTKHWLELSNKTRSIVEKEVKQYLDEYEPAGSSFYDMDCDSWKQLYNSIQKLNSELK